MYVAFVPWLIIAGTTTYLFQNKFPEIVRNLLIIFQFLTRNLSSNLLIIDYHPRSLELDVIHDESVLAIDLI